MELEDIILNEVTQTQKDMHGMYSRISQKEQTRNMSKVTLNSKQNGIEIEQGNGNRMSVKK